jgi:hypothetical protein
VDGCAELLRRKFFAIAPNKRYSGIGKALNISKSIA